MATIAASLAAAAASSSSTAHPPLGCGGLRKMKMVRSYPCTPQLDSSVFVFLLPRRLQQAHNPFSSTKQTLLPRMCGHEELEIVSVKELPDGFLHFSFGVPSNAVVSSKVDKRSSNCGEHVARTVAAAAAPPPHRLPSKFSKKSPIPSTVQRRKRQGDNSADQEKGEASTPSSSSSREVMKLTSTARPKPCFVKRSPIPVRKGALSVTMPEGIREKVEEAPRERKALKRPCSKFVRRSPVPASMSRHHAKTLPSSTGENSSPEIEHPMVRTSVSRPRSAFSRRLPIVTAGRLRSLSMSSEEAHVPPMSTAIDQSTRSVKSLPISDSMEVVDLDKCKLVELKSLAKAKGLKGYSKLKKGELLDILKKI